jgi:hypothetical protein
VKSCFPNGPLLFNKPGYEVMSWVGNFVGYIILKITIDVKYRRLCSSLRTCMFGVPQIHCHVQCYSTQGTKYKVLAGRLFVCGSTPLSNRLLVLLCIHTLITHHVPYTWTYFIPVFLNLCETAAQ